MGVPRLGRLGLQACRRDSAGGQQSSVRQSWTSRQPSPGLFDIRARTGYFVGSEFVAEPGRNVEIYVFAHHPVADDTADHHDPLQWRFHVVPVSALPLTKTISLMNVRKLALAVSIQEVGEQVEATAARCPGVMTSRPDL